jgi:hypothetical protein
MWTRHFAMPSIIIWKQADVNRKGTSRHLVKSAPEEVMTVGELMVRLQECPQDADIVVQVYNEKRRRHFDHDVIHVYEPEQKPLPPPPPNTPPRRRIYAIATKNKARG